MIIKLQITFMNIRCIKLKADVLKALLNDGVVNVDTIHDYLMVGVTYRVSGMIGSWIRCESVDENGCVTLRLVDDVKKSLATRSSSMRKVTLYTKRDNGAFLGGASNFKIGEVVAVCESYLNVINRLNDRAIGLGEAYRVKLAEDLGCDVSDVCNDKGFRNKRSTRAELLPRKIRIVATRECRARDVTDEEFRAMGISWLEGDDFEKRHHIGVDKWNDNAMVKVYRYETISGSVEEDYQRGREKQTFEEFIKEIYGDNGKNLRQKHNGLR